MAQWFTFIPGHGIAHVTCPEEAEALLIAEKIEAVLPPPQVCPEVHNKEPVNPERAMAAVRSMCAGGA